MCAFFRVSVPLRVTVSTMLFYGTVHPVVMNLRVVLAVYRENYLFICLCEKCVSQADDPDMTSEEEEEDDDDDDDDEHMS